MTNFRTTFETTKNKQQIDYNSKILSLGSCFSENIGGKLTYYKFPAVINPFGILYNPESIANSINFLLENKQFVKSDLFEHKGVWNSFYHHSRFSDTDKNSCLKNINNSINRASEHLKEIQFLLITFGTSWVYEYKQNGKIVSNCHKISSKEFNRNKLTVNQIVERYKSIIKELQSNNNNINIVFTVSPIRHLKDGVAQNQLSKSTLILAAHELVNEFENVSYFPSYEIMMDDLRDYRFYNDDMTHPSPIAINYVWNKFKETYIHQNSNSLMKDVDKINQAMQHRPFQPESEEHQKFLKGILKQIEKIESNKIYFDEERAIIQSTLL